MENESNQRRNHLNLIFILKRMFTLKKMLQEKWKICLKGWKAKFTRTNHKIVVKIMFYVLAYTSLSSIPNVKWNVNMGASHHMVRHDGLFSFLVIFLSY
jgi:hypothetical protein